MLRVVRIRELKTIADPFVKSLILRGIIAVYPEDVQPLDLYAEWWGRLTMDSFAAFVGFEDDEPDAVAVAQLPNSVTMIAPEMLLAYNEGRPALAHAVGERVRGWLLEHGYRRMWALNLNYADDVFMRGTAHFGAPRIVASIIEYGF